MNRTLFFFLTLFGMVILLVGGMSWVVFREVNLYIGLCWGAGVVLLLAGIFLNYQEVSQVARGRSAAKAFNAMVETVIVLAIVGFLYAIVAKYPQAKVDVTENKRLSLATQTVNVLKNLAQKDQTVNVTACITADSNFMIPVEGLLRKYRDVTSKFEYRIVDFVKNPTVRQEFGERLELGTTFVKSGGKQEKIAWPISEEKLTNAILKVVREGTTKVYFTEGHGEYPLQPAEEGSADSYAGLKSALEDQTYVVASLNIAGQEKDPIPADCNILVVGGPSNDFYPAEVDAIRNYLRRGGKALFLIDPPIGLHKPGAKSLLPLLSEYGVSVEEAVVVENNQLARQLGGLSPLQPICHTTGDSPIVKGLARTPFVLEEVVPLSTVNTSVYKVTTTPLMETSERSWGEKDFDALSRRGGTVSRNEDSERAGPLTVAVASEAEITDSTAKQSGDMTRIIVVGDSDFLTTGNLRRENQVLAQNMITWLAKYDEQIGIPPVDTEDSSLILSEGQKAVVMWIPTTVVPGGVLLLAIIVLFLRRRYA